VKYFVDGARTFRALLNRIVFDGLEALIARSAIFALVFINWHKLLPRAIFGARDYILTWSGGQTQSDCRDAI
jgi:hypothetical protein